MSNKLSGFSLIEALLTLLVVTMSSFSLMQLQVYVEQRAEFATNSITALNIAEQHLEWLSAQATTANVSSLADGTNVYSDTKFELKWQIKPIQWSSALELRSVEVQVEWFDRFGQPHQVTLNTMISD